MKMRQGLLRYHKIVVQNSVVALQWQSLLTLLSIYLVAITYMHYSYRFWDNQSLNASYLIIRLG